MITTETNDKEKNDAAVSQHHIVHHLKEKSIKVAGASYFLADIALLTSGVMAGQIKMIMAAVFGLSAGTTGAIFGNPKAEKQLEQLYHHLGDYLRKEGIKIPKDVTPEALSKEGGVFDHILSFLYTNPSQVMNVFYALIGTQFVRQAWPNMAEKIKTPSLFASGCCLIAGALGGLLIQEKKADPEHPPEGTLQKTWSWIQEKPLRLTGTLFNINQILLAKNGFDDRRDNLTQTSFAKRNSYVAKLAAVACFTFGNTMFALSSKSHGGGKKMDENTLNALAETSARVVAAQPKEVQDKLLEHVAGFLSTQQHLHMNAQEISAMLHTKLTEITHAHPAAPQDAGWQNRVAESKAVQPEILP